MNKDYEFQIVMKNLSQFSKAYLIPLGDFHEGAYNADHEISNGYIQWIREHDNAFTVLMGDMMNCLDRDTELLTKFGWKKHNEIVRLLKRNKDLCILGYDQGTKLLSWQSIKTLVSYNYEGELIRFTSRKMDIAVTPEHRILGQFSTSYGKMTDWRVKEAGDIKPWHRRTMRIPVAGKWEGTCCLEDTRIKIAAWVITEGWKSDYRLAISQSVKSPFVEEIDTLMKSVTLYDRRMNRDGVISWRFIDPYFQKLFRRNRWHRNVKRIPRELKELPPEKLRLLILTMLKGDGHIYKSGTPTFFTSSRELLGDFQEVCLKVGIATNTVYRANNKKGLYSIFLNNRDYFVPSKIWREPYYGRVWCPTIKTGFIVIRRNDKVAIVGNCAWKDSTPDLFEDLVTPDTAYDALRIRLEPIKDKIIMMTRGGHEEAIFRKVGHDYMAQLAYDLGNIPYRPNGGMFALQLSKNNHPRIFTGYAVHGWGGARTIGAKVKKAQDLTLIADVDIYLVAHDHTQNVTRLNMMVPPRSKFSMKHPCYMRVERKILVNTGGFCDYRGYIRRKGYQPQDLGTPRIRLEVKKTKNDYKKDIHCSV